MESFELNSVARPQDLLAGVLTELPTKYPGRGKVLNLTEEVAARLLGVPGVRALGNDFLVPHNLICLGSRPAGLFEYPPDPVAAAPSGLLLKDYQRRAVSFLRAVDRQSAGAILAADPGLGKTLTVLQSCWLDSLLHSPGLVIGPLGARGTWCSPDGDPAKHYGLQITALDGTDPDYRVFKTAQPSWFFIHYDILKAWQSTIFSDLKPKCLIIDEIHYVANPTGARWEGAFGVSGAACIERRIGLTGTPIPKTRLDLYGQLAVVQPHQWDESPGKHYTFGIRYLAGHRMTTEGQTEGRSWWVFDGRSNSEELRARLAGVYLRFTKADVPGELPGLVRHRIDVQLPPEVQAEYNLAKNNVLRWQASKGMRRAPETFEVGGTSYTLTPDDPKATQLVTVSALKSILDRGKLPQALSVIKQLATRHERIVVFTWRRESAKELCKQLEAARYLDTQSIPEVFGPIDGTDKWEKRIEEAKAFAQSDWAVFVATRGSVGIAINDLSCADACLQITSDWNPDGNLQAESRLHREGARAPEIHSYYMLAPKTLDDRVLELLKAKSEEAKAVSSLDAGGLHLVADLDPTYGDESRWSLDEICEMLAQVEDNT